MHKVFLLLLTFSHAEPTATPPDKVVELVASSWQNDHRLKLTFDVIEGHRIYKDSIKIRPGFGNELEFKNLLITPLDSFYDKFSNSSKQGVKKRFDVLYDVYARQELKNDSYPLVLEYQACSDEYCLFPQEYAFKVPIFIKDASLNLSRLMSESFWLAVIFVFFAGFLTSFTPCIFPMIPITLAVLVPRGKHLSFLGKLRRSLSYVFGIAMTYSLFGILAASSGLMFGSLLGNTWVAVAIGVMFTLFAVGMLGFFEVKTPAFLTHSRFFESSNTFFMGLIAGLFAGPCVGPVLLSILAFISQTGNISTGFILMMAFALGMGMIFVILGVAGEMINILPRSGRWMDVVKYIFATVMIGLAVYYVKPVLQPSQLIVFVGLVVFAICLLYLLFYQKKFFKPLSKSARAVFFAGAVISLTISAASAGFAVPLNKKFASSHYENGWQAYSSEKFEAAVKSGKPTIVDIYADWCMSCKELKATTFRAAEVIEKSKAYNLLIFDATHATPEVDDMKKKYGVLGLPTILFFSPNGVLRPELTLSGYENAAEFLQRMEKAARP